MLRLLWEWWGQIWPNAVVMVPGFVWHHRRLKRHIDRMNDK